MHNTRPTFPRDRHPKTDGCVRHSAAVHPRRPQFGPRPRPARVTVLAVGVIGLSVWQSQLSRQSLQARSAVIVLVVAAVAAALVLGRRRQQWTVRHWVGRDIQFLRTWRTQRRGDVASAVAWTVLIVGIVGWDLVSFAVQSHSFPTLSFFIGHITRYRIGRGVVFAVWLSLGAYLVSGRRTSTRR
jgi:hypothetical protein